MSQAKIVDIELIKATRIEKGITSEEMSKLMGYKGNNAYYRKENGDRKFSLEDVVNISKILDLPVQRIFFNHLIAETETDKRVS